MTHSMIRQELRTVALAGCLETSFAYMKNVKDRLEAHNIEVLSPCFDEPFIYHGTSEEYAKGIDPLARKRRHLQKFPLCDALIVCAPKGEVGTLTVLDIVHAQHLGKRIIFTEKPTDPLLHDIPAEIGLYL